MPEYRVLLVDDTANELERCRRAFDTVDGVTVVAELRSVEALKLIGTGGWDLLITDLRMPMADGLDLLRVARAHDPEMPVLMLTGFPSVDSAVSALKQGAADYLTKPVNLEELITIAQRLLETRRLRGEHHLLQRHVDRSFAFGEMIGTCPAMATIFETVRKLASSDVNVLITGETGTGKELVARSLHRQSGHSGHFVPVDCGALPEALMESELFGHEKGAFTGADRRSIGLLEFADQGTFFLDEVQALPLNLQAKLLRTLQEQRFRRVGGIHEGTVNVRVVAATNESPEQMVSEGRLREDLFYRLNVGRVDLPPLRSRSGDIPILVDEFMRFYQPGQEQIGLSADALEVLCAYAWPGNVRQLQNVLRRALLMSSGAELSVSDLPDEVVSQQDRGAGNPSNSFFDERAHHQDDFERQYLIKALRQVDGDVIAASEAAQIPRGTFYRLMKKHGLTAALYRRC